MPLAHASTLDRSGATAAARLRGGVLEPGARLLWKMRRQKQPSYIQPQLPLSGGRGPFSLGRGLDLALGLLQAEHHLLASRRFAFRTKKATLWVALASSCYTASRLAGATPCEGLTIVGPQQAERLLSARRDGRTIVRGRFDRVVAGVGHWHRSVLTDGRTIEQTRGARKSNLQIHELWRDHQRKTTG